MPGDERLRRGGAVLLLGSYRHTLAAARSLARAGWRVVTGHTSRRSYVDVSRAVSATWRYPPMELDRPAPFLAALDRYLEAHPDVRAVFPIDEPQVAFTQRHPPDLPDGVVLVSPSREATEACLSKTRSEEVFAELDIPRPPTACVTSHEALLREAANVGFPCIVKPDTTVFDLFGNKVVLAHDGASLREAVPTWPDRHECLLVQRHVSGVRHDLFFAAHRGHILASVELRILRTDRLDHTGYSVTGVTIDPTPGLLPRCEAVTARLDYTGIGCFQFLVDEDTGAQHVLEINPRLGANCQTVIHAGLDQPRLAVELARGTLDLDARPVLRPAGARQHWLLGDLAGARHAAMHGEAGPVDLLQWLGATALDFARADVHLTWRADDPRPTIAKYTAYLGETGREVLGRLRPHVGRHHPTGTAPPLPGTPPRATIPRAAH